MTRLFINLGKKDGITPKDVVGAITGEAGLQGRLIGQIDIYDKFCFVEVPKEYTDEVLRKMRKSMLKGKRFTIDAAVPKKK